MNKKYSLLFCIYMLCTCSIFANNVSYFQAPTKSVQFEAANVYLMIDNERTSKEGWTGRDSLRLMLEENEINKVVDKVGRFAVWKFVPAYIYCSDASKKRAMVEILVSNIPLESSADSIKGNGDLIAVPYKIKCRYRISDNEGHVLNEIDLGVLQGVDSTKNEQYAKGLPASSLVGIHAAYRRVRQDVFSKYGFGTFETPFNLADIPGISNLSELKSRVIDAVENKKHLLLTKSEKNILRLYTDVLSYNIGLCKEEQLLDVYHNLSICYAWLEEPEKAREAYEQYGKYVEGELALSQYNALRPFVLNYPVAAVKYAPLFNVINRNMSRFVDYYTYNDLICQIFRLNYPFQFFPLNDCKGKPKSIEGKITTSNNMPITYKLEYDVQNRIKSFSASQVVIDDEGKKEKIKINTLQPKYNKKTGEHMGITTFDGTLLRIIMPVYDKINSISDKMAAETFCKTENLVGGFIKMKTETTEEVQLSMNTDGTINFEGKSVSSRPFSFLKAIADSNNIKFPSLVSENHTQFKSLVKINSDGVITLLDWEGSILLEKNKGYDNYAYILADNIKHQIEVLEEDSYGQPQKIRSSVSMDIKNNWGNITKWNYIEIFGDSKNNIKLNEAKKARKEAAMAADQSIDFSFDWDVSTKYDDRGNWTRMELGPYIFERTISY